MLRIKSNEKGFTLIEAILVIAILIILGSVGIPVFGTFLERNNLKVAESTIVGALRSAQISAMNNLGDSDWGVWASAGQVVVYKGESYASRDTAFDIVHSTSTSVLYSGINEINFAKTSGLPNTTGDFVLSTTNGVDNISINEKGKIDY